MEAPKPFKKVWFINETNPKESIDFNFTEIEWSSPSFITILKKGYSTFKDIRKATIENELTSIILEDSFFNKPTLSDKPISCYDLYFPFFISNIRPRIPLDENGLSRSLNSTSKHSKAKFLKLR